MIEKQTETNKKPTLFLKNPQKILFHSICKNHVELDSYKFHINIYEPMLKFFKLKYTCLSVDPHI